MDTWQVEFEERFAKEFKLWDRSVRVELFAVIELLRRAGPALKRPYADTLNGSKHKNMKELRLRGIPGAWRVAFAFDPKRKAILLVGGDKAGKGTKKFYEWLVKTADERFDAHLQELTKKDEEETKP